MITILINRKKSSYDYKAYPKRPDSFQNNWKNNTQDVIRILKDNTVAGSWLCQSVANYCFGAMMPGDTMAHGDTVAPGAFRLKCFVPPRNFSGEIHAITRTTDLDGQLIDRNAMQRTLNGYTIGRWLIHNRYSKKLGRDTHYGWSAGCIILSSQDLKSFNTTLRSCGIRPGDEIHGMLEEEEC